MCSASIENNFTLSSSILLLNNCQAFAIYLILRRSINGNYLLLSLEYIFFLIFISKCRMDANFFMVFTMVGENINTMKTTFYQLFIDSEQGFFNY